MGSDRTGLSHSRVRPVKELVGQAEEEEVRDSAVALED